MKPAARIGDMHMCPMVTPGTPPIPHVGGPILGPGCPTVIICNMPAATMGDMCTCVGPPDTIALGSTGVFIGGKMAARMGDMCGHGGMITMGAPTVLIGEMSPGGPGGSVLGGLMGAIAQGSKVVIDLLVGELDSIKARAQLVHAMAAATSVKTAQGVLGNLSAILLDVMSTNLQETFPHDPQRAAEALEVAKTTVAMNQASEEGAAHVDPSAQTSMLGASAQPPQPSKGSSSGPSMLGGSAQPPPSGEGASSGPSMLGASAQPPPSGEGASSGPSMLGASADGTPYTPEDGG